MKKSLFGRMTLACLWLATPLLSPVAQAQPLYWQPWSPIIGAPPFINPPGNLVIGGWWNAPDYGRADIRICRLSDNLGRWSYGGFYDGSCNYYSHNLGRGHSVSIGFDLLGGLYEPRWVPSTHRNHRLLNLPAETRSLEMDGSKTDPTLNQQTQFQDDEMKQLCRIVQGDGAFVGTLAEETCYTAWQGLELISADYEVLNLEEN